MVGFNCVIPFDHPILRVSLLSKGGSTMVGCMQTARGAHECFVEMVFCTTASARNEEFCDNYFIASGALTSKN
jgi:hypothetical protein